MTGKGRYVAFFLWGWGGMGYEDTCASRGGVPLPLVSSSDLLLVILDRDNEEDQQGDALDPCQEEEIVVQRAVVDVTWKDRKQGQC